MLQCSVLELLFILLATYSSHIIYTGFYSLQLCTLLAIANIHLLKTHLILFIAMTDVIQLPLL